VVMGSESDAVAPSAGHWLASAALYPLRPDGHLALRELVPLVWVSSQLQGLVHVAVPIG